MCVLIFSSTLSKMFLILSTIQRDTVLTYIGLHVKYRYSCQILMELEFCRHIFEKSSNIKFHDNSSSGSRVVPCGQTDKWTDRRDAANRSFSQLKVLKPRLLPVLRIEEDLLSKDWKFSMVRALRQVTIHIPTTALYLNTIIYKNLLLLLRVPAFFGNPQGGIQQKNTQ
jgi:hypothetical protein